jgi:hypothetical protein
MMASFDGDTITVPDRLRGGVDVNLEQIRRAAA